MEDKIIKKILTEIESGIENKNFKDSINVEVNIPNTTNTGETNYITKIKFGIYSKNRRCEKFNWLEPKEITRAIYKDLMFRGSNVFFCCWVIIIPMFLGIIDHFYNILPPIDITMLRLIFEIISGSLFIGALVFFGAIIIETRKDLEKKDKLKEVWEEILKDITFIFSFVLLNLIFIPLSEAPFFKEFGIPILIAILSLVYYTFYLIINRLEKSFL